MTAQEVLELVDAGFTCEEIRNMQEPQPAMAPAPNPEPAPAPAPEPNPAPEPAPNPNPAPAPDPLASIKQQISTLTDVVTKMERSIVMPAIAEVKPLGIDDIVTKFFKED